MSRAAELASLRMLSCALGARLFPPSKWAGLFPSAAYRRSAPPQLAVGRLTPCGLGWFPVGWPILEGHRPAGSAGASHEACRRMAVCTRQAAGSRTRPASREACRRAAVASQPSCMSPEQPRALWARCGVQGYYPCPAYLPTQKREKMSSRSCSSTLSPVMRPSR